MNGLRIYVDLKDATPGGQSITAGVRVARIVACDTKSFAAEHLLKVLATG
jgi:hypothetical protein